jgi:2-polyprenyl-3-methyl-5-hydroxy-6-metoxy-1,4-benzoquinol methylase
LYFEETNKLRIGITILDYKDYGWTSSSPRSSSYLFEDLKFLLASEKKSTILDVGCGNGDMANNLIDLGYDVVGIDASSSGIAAANLRNNNRFYIQDISSSSLPLGLPSSTFDVVISTEVIEHIYDPRSYLRLCKSALKPGGRLVLSTPYHGYVKNCALAMTNKMDSHFTALWDGGHIKFWSVKTLTQALSECGFEVVEFRGSGRIPYLWKSMFLKAVSI